MWDGLELIDWEDLTHAYGSAGDVPLMLMELNSDDPEVRDQAFSDAYGNIFHQGDRYEATPYAVPFLLRILQRPGYGAVDELLYYLASLVVGYDSVYIPDGFGWEIERHRRALEECRADPERQESAEYLEAIVRITDEVRAGVDAYVGFLKEGDPEVRIAAAYVLAFLPESYGEFSEALLEVAASDPDVDLRGNGLIALALAGESADAPREPFEEALSSEEEFLRVAGAMGLAILGEVSSEVIATLLGVISKRIRVRSPFPWHFGEFATVATKCLARVCEDPQVLLDSLESSLAGMGTLQAASAATVVMGLLFPEGFGGETRALTAPQRRWLALLAGVATPWEFSGGEFSDDGLSGASYANFSLMMKNHGLPSSRAELAALLDDG